MKFTSIVYGAASGSVAGLTYSRNRGGPYTRRRAIPSNPATERQGIARENLASAVASWTNMLTDIQRQAWATYAAATPTVDSLGQQVLLSGQQMYIRSFTSNAIAGQSFSADGPTVSGLGNTPQWAGDPVVDASAQTIEGVAEIDDGSTDVVLAAYMSRPVTSSRTPAHEPRRFAFRTLYDSGDHVFTMTGAVPFPVTEGQRVRVVILALWNDGRVTAEAYRDVLVVA